MKYKHDIEIIISGMAGPVINNNGSKENNRINNLLNLFIIFIYDFYKYVFKITFRCIYFFKINFIII